MIQARVLNGRVEVQEAIPKEWEGHLVKILPLTPDDPQFDLEQRVAALHAMGAMELEPDERQQMAKSLAELDGVSKAAMIQIAGKLH